MNIAHDMIQTSCSQFKRDYGTYPDRVGLDYQTRLGEYTKAYGDTYWLNDTPPLSPNADMRAVTFNRVMIKIEPALFKSEGHSMVVCESKDITVFMKIEQGKVVGIWNKEEDK